MVLQRTFSALLIALLLVASAAVPVGARQFDESGTATSASTPTDTRPNIVVFYIDDAAAHDGRLWENPSLTPAIHELFVEHGIEFTNAYSETPLCCPARGNMLTGLHTHNTGVWQNDGALFDPREHIGKALGDAGYASMFLGKYLNKNSAFTDEQWAQHMSGWTYFDGIYAWNGAFLDYWLQTKDAGRIWMDDYHSTQMVGDRAVMRMRQVPTDTPVFQVLSIYNLHAANIPMPLPESEYAKCDSMPPWWTHAFNEADVSDKPAYVRDKPLLTNPDGSVMTDGWPMQGYCREMLGIDRVVTQVTDELAAQGRLDNTLMIFTADNGMNWGAHRWGQQKRTPYSTPIPLYMAWPAVWGTQPRTADEWTSNIDLAPTFCDVGGCLLDDFSAGQTEPDGVSLIPYLDALVEGQPASLGRDALLEQTGQWRAVRTTSGSDLGLWHYVEHKTGERELYDLSGGACHDWQPGMPGDPCELNNVAGNTEHAALVEQLSARLAQLKREGVVPRPDGTVADRSAGPYRGIDYYSSVPTAEQTIRRKNVEPGKTYQYFVKIDNDDPDPLLVDVKATTSGATTMRVTYHLGGNDVTSQVTGEGLIVTVAGSSSRKLVIRIFVTYKATTGSVTRGTVTVEPSGVPLLTDIVRAVAVR